MLSWKSSYLCVFILVFFGSTSVLALENVEPHSGYWMLEKTEAVYKEENVMDGVLLAVNIVNGQASGSCFGGGNSKVTWDSLPARASHRQEHTITFEAQTAPPDLVILRGSDMPPDERRRLERKKAACERKVHLAKGQTIATSASAEYCANFAGIGYSGMNLPGTYWHTLLQEPEYSKRKNWTFNFPHVSKVFICSQRNRDFLSDDNYKKIRDATKKPDTLRFQVNVYVYTAGGKATFIYHYVWVPGKMDEDPVNVTGRITDGHNHPMAYMTLSLTVDGAVYRGFTDEAGNYEFKDVNGLNPNPENPPKASLKAELSYVRDGVNYIRIPGAGGSIFLEKTFQVSSDYDLRQDVDFMISGASGNQTTLKDGDVEYKSNYLLRMLGDTAPIYYYLGDAVDFSLTILDADLNHNLPVDVYFGEGTYYSPGTAYIGIDYSDWPYTSPNRPKNREYHEFAHHLMYAEYGGWPSDRNLPNTKNHDGFLNPSTADSYMEGFAEFMAMVMSDYTNDPDVQRPPSQYAAIADLEDNFKVWEWRGRTEELAIAGALWDMYDKENEDGDRMTLTIHQMWPILKENRKDFYEYYKAFKQAFPEQSDAIDDIMLLHGIFADNNTGNNVRNNFEPYRDANNNRTYDEGEYFIDYGVINSTSEIRYDFGETIGKATNYQRPQRSMAVELPDAFIKVDDERVTYYTVTIKFDTSGQGRDREYTTEMRQGLIYLAPLPEDVEAVYTLKPKSNDYTGNTYTITAQQYRQKWYASEDKGYMDAHDFELKPTGKNTDSKLELPDGYKPRWGTDRGYNVQEPPPTIQPLDSNNHLSADSLENACFCIPLLPILLAALATILTKT